LSKHVERKKNIKDAIYIDMTAILTQLLTLVRHYSRRHWCHNDGSRNSYCGVVLLGWIVIIKHDIYTEHPFSTLASNSNTHSRNVRDIHYLPELLASHWVMPGKKNIFFSRHASKQEFWCHPVPGLTKSLSFTFTFTVTQSTR